MSASLESSPPRDPWWVLLAVLGGASLTAILCARPYATCWNDGSRLAIVEAVVDHNTLAIDDSIFVKVPPGKTPYTTVHGGIFDSQNTTGTLDKIYVAKHGHFYSDKTYPPSLIMALVYRGLQVTIGLNARESPERFCYLINLFSGGVPYVLAVWCVFRMGRLPRLAMKWRLLLTVSFAFGTLAFPYAMSINTHILLLALTCGITLQMIGLNHDPIQTVGRQCWRIAMMGMMGGLCYAFEAAIGQLLWGWTLVWIVLQFRSSQWFRFAIIYVLCSIPFLIWYHSVNYYVGGTLKPANMNLEYFQNWPPEHGRSPFGEENATGGWKHNSVLSFLGYGGSLLISPRGFLVFTPQLWLMIWGLIIFIKEKRLSLPDKVFLLAVPFTTWLTYAVFSNNYSGYCISIRWFLPLIGVCFYFLTFALRDVPRYRVDLLILTPFAMIQGVLMILNGPWEAKVPYFWLPPACAYLCWAAWRIHDWTHPMKENASLR